VLERRLLIEEPAEADFEKALSPPPRAADDRGRAGEGRRPRHFPPGHPIDSETETPWSVVGEMKSPIEGASGNVEYLMRLS